MSRKRHRDIREKCQTPKKWREDLKWVFHLILSSIAERPEGAEGGGGHLGVFKQIFGTGYWKL
jgi:hypothetical protein